MTSISASQTAKLLGVSVGDLDKLKKQGLVHAINNDKGVNFYSSEEISQIKSRRGPTLAEEAAQVNIGIQHETQSFVKFIKSVLMFTVIVLVVYVFLIFVFTSLFFTKPLETAKWLDGELNGPAPETAGETSEAQPPSNIEIAQ